MIETASRLALLAPVPLQHLRDGKDVAATAGRVAFGSRAWKLFRELDKLRKGLPVDVYIYASHSDDQLRFVASWHGHYVGHVESIGGAHPEGMRYRPPSTGAYVADNLGHWAIFWEVEHLAELPPERHLRIGDMMGFGKRQQYGNGFAPESPMLIEHP